jgi:hypothetical protein
MGLARISFADRFYFAIDPQRVLETAIRIVRGSFVHLGRFFFPRVQYSSLLAF